ncbi:MAG TPA: SDR family oxidoreductase [Flavobacterium sp.]|nr:SDR family oxidoreductase [Flavobacterium sp.]
MENLKEYLPQNLSGKKVLITGGTKGIGKATALLLAAQGAEIFIFGRNESDLTETLDTVRKKNPEARINGLAADVSKKEDIAKVFKEADAQLGHLDILINNAALGINGVEEAGHDDIDYVISTNLTGYLSCANEAISRMKPLKSGHIVNIGSMSAHTKEKDSSVYVATKSGIRGFSESLRKEINEYGIKVTLIEPGAVATPMQQLSQEEEQEKIEDQEMLVAQDIAVAVLYTLSQPKRCDVVSLQIRPHLQTI